MGRSETHNSLRPFRMRGETIPYIRDMHCIPDVEVMDEETRKIPAIVLVGVGGGGSRILSEGLEKVNRSREVDRYACIARAISADSPKPHVFIVDTSTDPKTAGF